MCDLKSFLLGIMRKRDTLGKRTRINIGSKTYGRVRFKLFVIQFWGRQRKLKGHKTKAFPVY